MDLDPARLWKFDAAAQLAGVSPELLASAIAHGDLPGVAVVSLGPRKVRFVRAAPFLAWLDGRPVVWPRSTPAVDLCVDLLT